MNEKLTKQVNILISEREYKLLYKEATRLSIENGSRCSMSSLIRKYIAPNIDSLMDASHDNSPHTKPDSPPSNSSLPSDNEQEPTPSIPSSNPTDASDPSNNFNFDDLSI